MFFSRANWNISFCCCCVLWSSTKKAEFYTWRVGEYLRCKATCVARSCWRFNFILQQRAWQPGAAAVRRRCRRSWPFPHPRLLRNPLTFTLPAIPAREKTWILQAVVPCLLLWGLWRGTCITQPCPADPPNPSPSPAPTVLLGRYRTLLKMSIRMQDLSLQLRAWLVWAGSRTKPLLWTTWETWSRKQAPENPLSAAEG